MIWTSEEKDNFDEPSSKTDTYKEKINLFAKAYHDGYQGFRKLMKNDVGKFKGLLF